jgi:alkylation response protein AidB-like acyl-CoA dehydrogenase
VDFTLTDEQELLVETARNLFTRECPSELIRRVADEPKAAMDLFDRHLREWVELSDGPTVDLSLFLVEAGAAVAPGPFLATAGVFAPLLRAAGHPLADDAAAGRITGTVAEDAHDGRARAIEVELVDKVALVGPGPTLAVVDAATVEAERVESMDLVRSTSFLTVPADVDYQPLDPIAMIDAFERAALAVASELVGVTRWLIDSTVAYAKERVQFGVPIGSFQAVQHKLVDMALAYEEAAAAVAYAAMCIDAHDHDRARAVHVAKARAGSAARYCSKDGMQIHGGIGYTWEHDLHLRLRRAYADDALFGTGAWHLDQLAGILFG